MAKTTQIMETCELCKLADAFCRCHRSASRTGRYPDDARLRAAGFTIYARPKNGKNIWTRNGRQFDELTALEIVEQTAARD